MTLGELIKSRKGDLKVTIDKKLSGLDQCRVRGKIVYVSEYAFALLDDEIMGPSIANQMKIVE